MRIADGSAAKYIVVIIYNEYEQGITGFVKRNAAVKYFTEQLGNGWEVYLTRVEANTNETSK